MTLALYVLGWFGRYVARLRARLRRVALRASPWPWPSTRLVLTARGPDDARELERLYERARRNPVRISFTRDEHGAHLSLMFALDAGESKTTEAPEDYAVALEAEP